jgi:hypothetical protein
VASGSLLPAIPSFDGAAEMRHFAASRRTGRSA